MVIRANELQQEIEIGLEEKILTFCVLSLSRLEVPVSGSFERVTLSTLAWYQAFLQTASTARPSLI